ncbi:DUF2599 domain-containing protein [Cellulomonas sp. PhB143]|uniref:DUF2599 domain-containing protein n=1 Tax=Cellulomonas sp. PhB143 TaxID=2485186 RepID=UPI000FA3DE58|nr:DUF2599 domain-containing protein [Cellulomonas sp. PhB143]ROS76523.1 uncharacterized protein DUF2599 [Cellulomonas sp. PhB143]
MSSRPRAASARAAVALACGLLCAAAGCSAPGAPDAGTAAPTSPSRPPSPAPHEIGRLEVGDVIVVLRASAGTAEVADGPATSRTARTDDAVGLTLALDGPGGARFSRDADATVSVVGPGDDDAATVGGLAVTGDDVRVAVADREVTVGPQASGSPTSRPSAETRTPPAVVAATVTLGADALVSATWGEAEGGRSLAVVPSDWARQAGAAGADAVWSAVVAAEPDADTPGMHDQLECHALGATDKASWNLEPWRPDVGFVDTALARCNPT